MNIVRELLLCQILKFFPVAVYMSRYKHLWEHDKIFDTSLSCGESSDEAGTPPPQKGIYGPGKMGCTYELCAGIVDKKMSLQQIAQEEVIEETGNWRHNSVFVMLAFESEQL